jgi:GNAT superfamily N-acetyltransferase
MPCSGFGRPRGWEPSVSVQVVPVRSGAEKRAFLSFPYRLYSGDPLWVPPLYSERRDTLDPVKGEFFRHGQAQAFVARRDGRTVGTIVAAEDFAANEACSRKDCLFGFYDYVEDYGVAAALMGAAGAWGGARGLETLFGPNNLDYENAYGVLVEGRDRPPALLCGHSPSYYLGFMERMGFEPSRDDNIAFELRLDQSMRDGERLARVAKVAAARSGITVRGADFSHIEDEIDRIHGIMNRSLAHLQGYLPIARSGIEALVRPFVSFADPELVLFAEKKGETVGFLPAVPNLNEAFARLGGLRYPWQYLRLPFVLKRKFECVTVKSILVPPEHWRTGVGLVLMDEIRRRLEGRPYSWLDLSLTSAENPNTVALALRFGARIYKRYRLFRGPIGERWHD